ncbi:hypothetical protein A2U01_0078668, partial [Trifolium medium]|nr:hypothetical protein [Trifolium medium]
VGSQLRELLERDGDHYVSLPRIYAIMGGEPIQIGEMIARSINRMITGPDSYIGHPFVITTLCQRLHVPTEDDTDEIAIPVDPLGRVFFKRAV